MLGDAVYPQFIARQLCCDDVLHLSDTEGLITKVLLGPYDSRSLHEKSKSNTVISLLALFGAVRYKLLCYSSP